jgi:methyl-accepting chemotaxis protein
MKMGSSMTIGKRFIITSGVLISLSVASAVVATVSLSKINSDARVLASDSLPGTFYAAAVERDMLQLRGDYLRHIGETNPTIMQEIEQNLATNGGLLVNDLKSYEGTISTPEDRAQFESLKSMIAPVLQGWEKVLPVSREGKNVEAFQLYDAYVVPSMNQLKGPLSDLVSSNKRDADATMALTIQTVQAAWWMALVLGITLIVAGVGVSWFMIRALSRELNTAVAELSQGAVQIASAASQVASSSQSLAQGASEQAASLEETSATTNEINSMASRNSENAGAMTEMVAGSQLEFVATNQQLSEMVAAMDEINDSSAKISKIIKVIDEIAFQTNILALNAAVEAARAGEAGMGFAVVADEVRNLAQRCAQAAKDTADLIEDSIGRSGSGKTKVAQVASAIQRMTDEFAKVKTLVDEVGSGSKEQTDGLEQIRRALTQMEQVSQSTAATAEQSAAAAQELNAQSEALKTIVVRLNSMVGGDLVGVSI